MILQTTKKEAAALTMHLAMMRPSFRNLLKKQFKDKKDQYLQAYDYVIELAKTQIEEDVEIQAMNLNIIDVIVLEDFLRSYLAKAAPMFDEAKVADREDHVQTLQDVQWRCKELLDDVS